MRFDDLDKRMRLYEESTDRKVPPDVRIVARLDGRGFSQLTAEGSCFEKPFDYTFKWLMGNTTKDLMNCGFNVEIGYHQSDEISLLFKRDEDTFNRKTRKYISTLAGVASASFSLAHGKPVSFDCRISELPTDQHVFDYFAWRTEDAHRNCLNSHCYWLLRNQGHSAKSAANQLLKSSKGQKHELLFKNNIVFEKLPDWQRYGCFYGFQEYEKAGWNPVLQREEVARRRMIARLGKDGDVRTELEILRIQLLGEPHNAPKT